MVLNFQAKIGIQKMSFSEDHFLSLKLEFRKFHFLRTIFVTKSGNKVFGNKWRTSKEIWVTKCAWYFNWMQELDSKQIGGKTVRFTVVKDMFRLGTYKAGPFESDQWIKKHASDAKIWCTFCNKLFSSRRHLWSHWNSTHHKVTSSMNNNTMRKCPIDGCSFE